MIVTYNELFQFCILIVSIISLVYQIAKKEVTAGTLPKFRRSLRYKL